MKVEMTTTKGIRIRVGDGELIVGGFVFPFDDSDTSHLHDLLRKRLYSDQTGYEENK